MESQDTGINPKAKETPLAEISKPVMTRSKRFVKMKPRKQVKEQVSKIAEVKEMTQEQSANKPIQRRLNRSQIAKEKGKSMISGESLGLKGNLNDILQAIDIEESPLVQADFIKFDEGYRRR